MWVEQALAEFGTSTITSHEQANATAEAIGDTFICLDDAAKQAVGLESPSNEIVYNIHVPDKTGLLQLTCKLMSRRFDQWAKQQNPCVETNPAGQFCFIDQLTVGVEDKPEGGRQVKIISRSLHPWAEIDFGKNYKRVTTIIREVTEAVETLKESQIIKDQYPLASD